MQVRHQWKAFPTQPLTGCLRAEATYAWSWEAGAPADGGLQSAWEEWLTFMEIDLCRQFDIVGAGQQAYRGRSEGVRLKTVQLADTLRQRVASGTSDRVRAWRACYAVLGKARRLCAQLAGPSGAFQQLVEAWDSLDLTKCGDFDDMGWSKQQVRAAILVGGPELDAIHAEVGRKSKAASRASAQVQLQEWKEWAIASTKCGAKQAHRFSK